MCLGEEDRGSPTEGPPRAFANRHVSKRRQGSENEVEPSSHRGRKPMKNTEMVKKKKKKTLNSDVISDHIESVFLMFTFERFYGFASCFKKKNRFGKTKQKTNKQKVALVMLERGPFPVAFFGSLRSACQVTYEPSRLFVWQRVAFASCRAQIVLEIHEVMFS